MEREELLGVAAQAGAVANRLHLNALVVRRTLQNFRPGSPAVYERMQTVHETLAQLSRQFPSGAFHTRRETLRTTERYVGLAVRELTLCAVAGYSQHRVLHEELMRVADDLRALQSELYEALTAKAKKRRAA